MCQKIFPCCQLGHFYDSQYFQSFFSSHRSNLTTSLVCTSVHTSLKSKVINLDSSIILSINLSWLSLTTFLQLIMLLVLFVVSFSLKQSMRKASLSKICSVRRRFVMYPILILSLSETFIKSIHDCEHTPIPIKTTNQPQEIEIKTTHSTMLTSPTNSSQPHSIYSDWCNLLSVGKTPAMNFFSYKV